MWILDNDTNKWLRTVDRLPDDTYNFLKQELSSVRFYSKCLSGATYLPVNDSQNIYDVLSIRQDKDWYISFDGSVYSETLVPAEHASPINATSSFDFYTRNLSEYNLSLKNLFTPKRLLKNSFRNYIEVDLATTQAIDIPTASYIDGVKLVNGHKVLVKNQKTSIVLPSTIDADEYFRGTYEIVQNFGATIEYTYFNEENGIYEYIDGLLVRTNNFDTYEKSIRFSVLVKTGEQNTDRQFHLKRLTNGYFSTDVVNDPFEFEQKKNWILRNRVDYNNLFEINYFDIIKHGIQIYNLQGVTYSIPERTISIGEFGTIINYQVGVQNIIYNKYKVNLRGISQTSRYYWICGDDGVLLRTTKHNFKIERIKVDCLCPRRLITTNLRSISFFDDLKGVAVGDLNTILFTEDGGYKWERIKFEEFNAYYFTKVYFYSSTKFFVAGNNGIFLEFVKDISGWSATRRRISRFIDDEEEYVLVDNINDIFYTTVDFWGLTFSYTGQTSSNPKEILFIVGDDSKIIAYDLQNTVPNYDFIYLDFDQKYGDIRNFVRQGTSSNFYFTGIDEKNLNTGLFSFDLNNFQYIGVGNSYSNTVLSSINPEFRSDLYSNEIFDYNGQELFLCGNESLIGSTTYSSTLSINVLDENFENRLKSKLLFLDYDVASKLNFFTDFGDYRLPESVSFGFSASTGYYLDFTQLVISATAPSYLTQSEHNWFEYWQDSTMTFEYYSQNPMKDSTKVVSSPKFIYSSVSPIVSYTTKTTDESILPLAPKILESDSSRFNGFGMTAISSPNVSSDIYFYDYLMVVRLSSTYPVEVGDTLYFESGILVNTFIVNKIVNLSGYKYAYLFTEFNDTILNQLSVSTDPITITNLNKFQNLSQLKSHFYLHPISSGYDLSLSSKSETNLVHLDFANGGNTASYIGWSFSQNFTQSSSFTNSTTSYSLRTNSAGYNYILSPEVEYVDKLSFYYSASGANYLSGTYSYLEVQGWSSSSWYNLTTIFISNGSIANQSQLVEIDILGQYNKFKINFYTSGSITGPLWPLPFKWIAIDDIKLISGYKVKAESSIYGLTSSLVDEITIESKFNNLTAYYNLAQKVKTPYDSYDMYYKSGFLKFGYTPTFNLLDYLESINDLGDPNPKFYANKEYYSMPHFLEVPLTGIGDFSDEQLYIDYNGFTYSNVASNIILFGDQRKLEWDSLLVNTFVDIVLYATSSVSTTERLLIIDKYQVDLAGRFQYAIVFDRSMNYTIGSPLYFIDILSRRKLSQISEDLQILNNIQKLQNNQTYDSTINSLYQANFSNFNRFYNFKINTDSYAKYMLSDFSTYDNISAVIYTDSKNEFAMNVTKLDREFSIPILNTANFGGKLFILCSEKHELKTGDGVNLEFNGGTFSSEFLNQQYLGYRPVIVVNEYNFYVDLPYGNPVFLGNDTGFVKYVRQDPFLNYQPVDLIEVGSDLKVRQSIELMIENTGLSINRFFLQDVNFQKFRFRLVDNLDLETLESNYPWMLEAEITDAIIGFDISGLIWYKGTWECGRWFGGTWISGAWISGDWYGGVWSSKRIKDNFIEVIVDEKSSDNLQSTWFNGRWYDGTWNSGTWINGRWYDGTWNTGEWYKGIWNDGTWLSGKFTGGIWVLGTWENGTFNCDNEPAYWIDGNWNGGDFENGMWYNGTWVEKNAPARFGVKSSNSRTATWHAGKWLSGSFHSKENVNQSGKYEVCDTHRYSIWRTGLWQSGDFYGGIVYNIDFKSGIWYGGILEDIQVIGFTGSTTTSENYFTLNGIFKFNIGDTVTFIDNQIGNLYSQDFGSNLNPQTYTILYTTEDPANKWTNIYVDRQITYGVSAPVDLGLRLVSTFRNCNWKTGIWTNGIYEKGLWEGGIWYNGVFQATWM